MLKELRFVQGAVARKDYVPALTHFRIQNGTILGYNGRIALSTPVALDLACSPRATPFIKAIQTCTETVQLHLTENGRLAVRSGPFSVYVECYEEEYPAVEPEGETVPLSGGLLSALESLSPFVGQDASRAWARGVLFRGKSAFATNNIVAVERWLGTPFPVEINIPEEAVDELIRIGEEPVRLQMSENSATFHFEGGGWLRTQLLTTSWPEVDKILDRPSSPAPLPQGFFQALTSLLPFTDDLEHVYLLDGKVSSSSTPETGANVQVPGVPPGGIYNIKHLLKLESIVQTIDFAMYPDPCIFYGDQIRGAIIGMRI